MILDMLESMKEAGLQISDYRYIGMGGIKFYDFSMVYRFLGIKDLISFERNKVVAKRGVYNKPFGLIDVRNESISNYLKSDLKYKPTICWLDYDNSLSESIIDDIRDIGTRIPAGSAVFVTVASEMPRDFLSMSEAERLSQVIEDFGVLAADVDVVDVEEANFGRVYYKILRAAFTNSFAARDEAEFLPCFRVVYNDSLKMLTYGGAFVSEHNVKPFLKSVRRRMPFLFRDISAPYSIRTINMTERERHLMEFSSTARLNCAEANKLRSLGYKAEDISAYRDLVRFMPRYVETLM